MIIDAVTFPLLLLLLLSPTHIQRLFNLVCLPSHVFHFSPRNDVNRLSVPKDSDSPHTCLSCTPSTSPPSPHSPQAPLELVRETRRLGRLPVVNFAAGGIATPADAALMMQARWPLIAP